MFLIISCSQIVHPTIKHGKARDIFTGALFKKCVQYADKNKLKLYIVSAKYGLIDSDAIIETYCFPNKLIKPYLGIWPEGAGYFVGSRKRHFRDVPDRIKPLMPEVETEYNFGIGRQLQRMNELLTK